MSSRKTKKLKLFEIGSKAIQKIDKDSSSIYICPICSCYFNLDDLHNGKLTLEHDPPSSVGGKAIALTCSHCNNKSGHTIDVAINNRHSLFDLASRKTGIIKGKLILGGEEINVGFKWKEGQLEIRTHEKINNPISFKRFSEHLNGTVINNTWEGQNFDLKVTLPYNERLAEVGDLKSAFLVALSKFGYRYALHPMLEKVRNK
jgi:hypothetical protein